MDADLKKKLQISLLVFIVIAGIRVGFILYARRDTGGGPKKPETTYSSNMDDYVTPHKIFPYNVESAKKELVGKPMWVKTGNVLPYYPYDAATHTVNFKRQAGLLPPVAKLQVKDVVLARDAAPLKSARSRLCRRRSWRSLRKRETQELLPPRSVQIPATITPSTQTTISFSRTHINSINTGQPMSWSAIDQHQAKQGMSELQASFALGTNMSASEGDYGNRTIEFANAGKPVTVTFEKNKATTVTQGKAQ